MARPWNVLLRASLRRAKKPGGLALRRSRFVAIREYFVSIIGPIVAAIERFWIVRSIQAWVVCCVCVKVARNVCAIGDWIEVTGVNSVRPPSTGATYEYVPSAFLYIHPPNSGLCRIDFWLIS